MSPVYLYDFDGISTTPSCDDQHGHRREPDDAVSGESLFLFLAFYLSNIFYNCHVSDHFCIYCSSKGEMARGRTNPPTLLKGTQ